MNPRVNRGWNLAIVLAWAAAAPGAWGQAGDGEAYQQILKREFGTASEAMAAIEKETQNTDQYPAVEARLIGVLESPEATMPAKQFACQMLRTVGSAKCVAAVGRLLTDEKLSHMARYVLLGMPGPAVDDLLRSALSQTQGNLRIGIINTLGDRRDRQSLEALAAFLTGHDDATARSALNAIGKIGGARAADILERAKVADSLKRDWSHAYLRCAEGLAAPSGGARAENIYRALFEGDSPPSVRAAALGSLVKVQGQQAVPLVLKTLAADDALLRRVAISAAITLPGHAATLALARQLPGLKPETKIALLAALAARGDAVGITDTVNGLAADEDQSVRVAALSALARLGNASSIPVLVAALKDTGPIRLEAAKTVVELQGEGVAEALLKQVQTGDLPTRLAVLGVLSDRHQADALPTVRQAAAGSEPQIRQTALRTIATLGGLDDLAWLAPRLLAVTDEAERNLVERAMSSIGGRLSDKAAVCRPVLQALPKADVSAKVHLLAVLSATGGEPALPAVRAALAEGGEVKKAALRALADWPSAAPMGDLLDAAKGEKDSSSQIVAVRGYIRMIGLAPGDSSQRLQGYRQAMALASRPDEKRLVLAGLADVADAEALTMVEPFLAEVAFKREALIAYEKIAESLARQQPAVAKAALQRVVDDATDARLRGRASAVLNRIK